jgi:hypothetical protein
MHLQKMEGGEENGSGARVEVGVEGYGGMVTASRPTYFESACNQLTGNNTHTR